MSYFEKTTFSPVASATDAFGRLRVSENYTIFDSKQIMNKSDEIYLGVQSNVASLMVASMNITEII